MSLGFREQRLQASSSEAKKIPVEQFVGRFLTVFVDGLLVVLSCSWVAQPLIQLSHGTKINCGAGCACQVFCVRAQLVQRIHAPHTLSCAFGCIRVLALVIHSHRRVSPASPGRCSRVAMGGPPPGGGAPPPKPLCAPTDHPRKGGHRFLCPTAPGQNRPE